MFEYLQKNSEKLPSAMRWRRHISRTCCFKMKVLFFKCLILFLQKWRLKKSLQVLKMCRGFSVEGFIMLVKQFQLFTPKQRREEKLPWSVAVTSLGLTFRLFTKWGEMRGLVGDSLTRSRLKRNKNVSSFAWRQEVVGLIEVLCNRFLRCSLNISRGHWVTLGCRETELGKNSLNLHWWFKHLAACPNTSTLLILSLRGMPLCFCNSKSPRISQIKQLFFWTMPNCPGIFWASHCLFGN